MILVSFYFFFFQAEDGIRDDLVTGVQTCALPIYRAQHDYTQALDAARTMHDRAAEWQSAIDLGFLWVQRDYAQAETWFRQALILSQALEDPALHARSLNRIGHWHLNLEQPH